MKYNFDVLYDRKNTSSVKWDGYLNLYKRDDLICLGCADMDFKAPQPIIDELVNLCNSGIFGYTNVSDRFYDSIVYWYKKRHKLNINKDNLIFTPRINIACSLLIDALCNEDEKVIISDPAYPPLKQAAYDNKRAIVNVGLKNINGNYELDLDSLEQNIDEKCKFFILVNPHNPTTRCFTDQELLQICNFCIKHDLYLFVDEIHSDFVKSGYSFNSILKFEDKIEDRLLYANSPAKSFNVMGALIAYMYIPNKRLKHIFYKQLQKIGEHNPSIFANALMNVAYYKSEDYLDELNNYIDQNEQYFVLQIKQLFDKAIITKREGTYLLWIDFSAYFSTSDKMKDFFINKARVAPHFGDYFHQDYALFTRFNLACPKAMLQEVISRLKQAVDKL